MTLTDAGPLIAIIDADEPDHAACLDALDQAPLPPLAILIWTPELLGSFSFSHPAPPLAAVAVVGVVSPSPSPASPARPPPSATARPPTPTRA